jgi:hypothetical protein
LRSNKRAPPKRVPATAHSCHLHINYSPGRLYAQLLHELRVCQRQQHHLLQLLLHISQPTNIGKPASRRLPPLLLLLLQARGFGWLQQCWGQLLRCFSEPLGVFPEYDGLIRL